MIFTIGHSTLSEARFMDVALKMPEDRPRVICDVRSHPTSKWPQFRRENMRRWIPAYGLEYIWEPRLGGWTADHMPWAKFMAHVGVDVATYSKGAFPKQRIALEKPNAQGASWTNQGLYDYSWFTALPDWLIAADKLARVGQRYHIAILCAEVLWWKCHRSMIADYLVWKSVQVTHLQPKVGDHGKALGNRLDRYHPLILEAWRHGGLTR